MLALVVLVYGLIVLLDIVPIYKDKPKKDFWVSTSLLTVSFIITVLLSFGINIPSPAGPLKQLINMIYHLN